MLLLILASGVNGLLGQNLVDEQGRKSGQWKVEYPGGNTLYEASFHEGRPVGLMIRYYESGAVRARMMFDSIEDRSFTRLYYKNGKKAAEGLYINKVKDSVWTYYSEFDGTVRISEPYLEGNLHGEAKSFYPGGIVSEQVSWVQNIREGPWKQYYKDGSLRLECQYKNDLLNGPYKVYYSDNTLKVRGEYFNNKSHGIWSYFDETGEEIYAIEFLFGKAVEQEKYLQLMQDSLSRFEVIAKPEFIQQQ